MSYLLDLFLCGWVVIMELVAVILGAVLVQFICYQVFGINIVNTVFKSLNKLDKYLNRVM